MEGFEPFLSLGVALGIGLLVGFERERSAAAEKTPEAQELTAGARTYPLIALGGALAMLLSRAVGLWLVLVALVAALAPLVIAFWSNIQKGRDPGGTSEAAALVVFLLGVLTQAEAIVPSLENRLVVCASLGVVVTLLLSVKMPLHQFAHRVSREDVFSTLKFLVVAVVILPLLPNRTFGPLDVLNPYEVGLMIVLIAGLSFVGYVAVRVLGPGRGLVVTGLVGGLASSTAVTLTFSGKAKREPYLRGPYAMAVILASTLMYLRVIVEVAVVNRALVADVAPPLALMCLASTAAAALQYWRDKRKQAGETESGDGKELELKNPVELGLAVKFGLLFGGVLLLSKAANVYVGESGTYVAALLAGLTDVDAITLSLAKLAHTELTPQVATLAILIGTASNTLVKAGLAIGLGGWAFGRVVLLSFVAAIAAGAVGLLFL
jgi:uncharacterized membrane protein (DUF4010 family)